MAQIRMTQQLIAAHSALNNDEIFGGNYGFGPLVGDSGLDNVTSQSTGNRLVLYKGAFPTDLKTNATTTNTNLFYRSSDKLVTIPYYGRFSGIVDGAFTFKESAFAIATGAGVATWFAMYSWNNNNPMCTVFGDISNLTGNGMMKLPDTNIVVGQRISVGPMKLTIPNEFTY